MTLSLREVKEAARQIAKDLRGGEIFGLIGPLGSGKTTFAQALGKELKVKQKITSPTFILLQGFEARLPRPAAEGNGGQARKKHKKIIFYHLDLYRIKSFKEARSLGLMEFWGKPKTVTVIEWADRIKKYLPKKTKLIKFKH